MVKSKLIMLSKLRYVFPNLSTTLSLSCGFYAIICSIDSNFNYAAIMIVVAFFFDGIDGRVAYLLNAQSKFGGEYDSFADLVSFGMAPAILIDRWALIYLDKKMWLIALFYCVATAFRLARFNILKDIPENEKFFFSGLPCAIASGLISSIVLVCYQYHINVPKIASLLAALIIILSCMMMTTVKFYNIKIINTPFKLINFILVFLVIIIFAINNHYELLLAGFLFYLYGGYHIFRGIA